MAKLLNFLVILALFIGCASTIQHKKAVGNVNSDVVTGDRAPEKLTNPKPIYPKLALMNGHEAIVWVSSTIDSTGQVIDVKIEKVIGKENIGFEESAIEAAFATKWKPPVFDGKVSGTTVTYKITYSLKK